MRRFLVLTLLISVLVAPVPALYAQDGTNKPKSTRVARTASRIAAEGITAAQLRDYLYFVASDEMEGRDTPSRGLNITAKFIATLLSRWGVKPAGDDGTYFQKIEMGRERIDAAATRAEINGQPFKFGDDFLAIPRTGTATGALVFVGHGWFIKSKDIDAYRGVDVKNKIVVLSGDRYPNGVTPSDLNESMRGVDWLLPREYAKKMGALGVISLPSPLTIANWDRVLRRQQAGGALEVVKLTDNPRGSLPDIALTPKMADALLQGEKHSADEIFKSLGSTAPIPPFDFDPAKKVSLTISAQDDSLSTQNVIGMIEGSDPKLKTEYVAIGAHYDHVGTGPAGSNGRGPARESNKADIIYNGADDDGSGTVSLLSMAEAISRAPRRPKRSVLFVWHCGEEKGLWGSKYFTRYPTVPIDRIIAQFNIDMIGRSKATGDTSALNRSLTGPNEIYVIGSKMMSTELGELSERVNRTYLNLSFNYLYDNPTDPNRFFFRSDHYNYAQKGIPIIFYFDGVHEDYHRPGDEPEKIDFDKMQRVARTVFVTMWETADLKSRPVVDKKLPPELTGR